jgi:hypothetical protein
MAATLALWMRPMLPDFFRSACFFVIATFAPDAPRTWTGTFGLGVPGAATTFKLYSITEEGNERGSNAVTVTRPA